MTSTDAPAGRDILKALEAPSTCTKVTLTTIEELLLGTTAAKDGNVSKENDKPARERTRANTLVTKPIPNAGHRRTQTTVQVATLKKQKTAILSVQEKLAFAFQVVNLCLKTLSQLSKDRANARRLAKEDSGAKPVPRSKSRQNNALGPQSPNARRGRAIDEVCALGPRTPDSKDPSTVAACASVSLSYLRDRYPVAEKKDTAYQVEQGLLSLVEKCIDLEVEGVALVQLQILKDRLDEQLEVKSKKRAANRKDAAYFSSLLTFPGHLDKTNLFTLAIKFQFQVIRYVNLRRDPGIIEELSEFLADTSPSSKVASLFLHHAQKTEARPKALRQLEMLSRILMELCAVTAHSTSKQVCGTMPSAECVLRLNLAAFELQLKLWQISEQSKPEDIEGLWHKISRCVETYARNTASPGLDRFTFARRTLAPLLDSFHGEEGSLLGLKATRRRLGEIARDAGLVEEATTLIPTASSVRDIVRDASGRFATDHDFDALQRAVDVLSRDLSSVGKEMERLLLEVNSLRRNVHKAISEDSAVLGDSQHLDICLQACQSCVRFLRMYLEHASEDLDKLCMAKRVAKGFIITAILACQRIDPVTEMDCVRISSTLKACHELFVSLAEGDETFGSERFNTSGDLKSSIFVKISNLCYNIWARKQGQPALSPATLDLLRQSVSTLQPWSQEEKENGRYAAKLQFLIEAYMSCDDFGNAYASLLDLLRAHVDSGCVSEVARRMVNTPLKRLRHDGAIGRPIFRALTTCITILLRTDLAYINGHELDFSIDERGLLMEWQLEILIAHAPEDEDSSNRTLELVLALLDDLFTTYTKKLFPGRRLRVAVMAARLSSTAPKIWEAHGAVIEDQLQPITSLGNDQGLQTYIPYLHAMLFSILELSKQGDRISADESIQQLLRWRGVLQVLTTHENADECIEDVEMWNDHMAALADYYAMRGDSSSEVEILELSLGILELCSSNHLEKCVELQCRLGQTFVQTGYTRKAGEILARARPGAENKAAADGVKIKWHLAYAEYLLAIGDSEKCKETLQEAERIATHGEERSFVHMTFRSSKFLKVDERLLLVRAALLHSKLELMEGRSGPSLRLNTIAKNMLFHLWSSLERSTALHNSSSAIAKEAGASDDDSSNMTETTRPLMLTRTYSRLTGPRFWKLVPDLIQTALHEKSIYDFQGKCNEADSAIGRAVLVADTVSSAQIALCHAAAADLYVRSRPVNDMDTRDEKVDQARAEMDKASLRNRSKEAVILGFADAKVLLAEGQKDAAVQRLRDNIEIIREVIDCRSIKNSEVSNEVDVLADKLATVQLTKTCKTSAKTTRSKGTTVKISVHKVTKITTTVSTVPADPPISSGDDCMPLNALHGQLLRDFVLTTMDQPTERGASSSSELLDEASHLQFSSADIVNHGLAKSRFLAHQASELIAGDISFNALPDSIVSLPAPQQRTHTVSLVTVSKAKASQTKRPKITRKTKAGKQDSAVPASLSPFAAQLQAAHESLRQNFTLSLTSSSYATFREQSRLLSDLSIMVSATSATPSAEVIHPLSCAYYNELPNVRVRYLDHVAEHPDVEKLSKVDLKRWPTVASPHTGHECANLDRAEFLDNFIDILPKAWNVVSMSLSDDKSAIKLVRYRHGQSPFVLRIPFAHRAAVDMDEEILDVVTAFTELREIIRQHTFVAREPGVTNTAEYREKYWEEKRHFDGEVRRLLFKVEHQWFGAFKGMFSQSIHDPQALANFQAQLQGILMQHCPSCKTKGKGKNVPPLLEPRILELFVGLGDPSEEVRVEMEEEEGFAISELAETSMMADGIQDLVRLILENMQFNGESIAIDEVDFDVVTIAIIDALKEYYATVSTSSPPSCKHTVLILDNHLHGFPWESLPTLRHQSVSRLSSLAELRERILAARLSASEASHQGHTISRTSGTSLLNPSGDLTRTAERFQPWLNKLPASWAHLRHAPDDEGWRAMLSENELFLYVGHGSTSQYVRPRVVRKLQYQERNGDDKKQTCAVSWLIGCGSAAVQDHGEFEPSGMVLAYVAAGAPAVLGALWDVGDRDADEFSIWTGEWWGLWGEGSLASGQDKKMGAKKKAIEKEKGGRKIGLCEAVAKGRETCMLKYLNGAAFVVYGIPVFLGD